ncbi:MAG TPA: lipid II flippase MurJ [Thermoleophilaceae bacterium]
MTATPVPPPGRLASNAVVTAVAQGASMLLGGVVALIIQLRFGKDAETDGLFAAYGVYGILVVVAVSFRATIVARLVEGPSLFEALDRYLGAATAIFLGAAIPLVALGAPIASALIGDVGQTATDTARTALLVFWLAAGTQLANALFAAALGVRDQFLLPGAAYVTGGVLAVVGLLALAPALGIQAVPLAIAIGGVVTAAMMLMRLVRLGYRPRLARLVPDRGALARAGLLLWAAVGAVAGQITYVATIGFAARLGEGEASLYTYGYFLMVLFVGILGGAMTIALAPRLAETWDLRPESLHGPMVDVFRAGSLVVLPVVGVMAIAGEPLAGIVFAPHDAREVVAVFLALSGGLLLTTAVPVPQLAMYTRGRYGAVAVLAVLGVALQFGFCAVAVTFDWLPALGVAATVTGSITAWALFALVFGRRWPAAAWLLVRELAPVAAVAAIVFVPAGFVGALGGAPAELLAAVVALGVFCLLARASLPGHWHVAERLLAPLGRRFARLGAAAR